MTNKTKGKFNNQNQIYSIKQKLLISELKKRVESTTSIVECFQINIP